MSGAVLIVATGLFFYLYVQNLLATAASSSSSSSTSLANALGIYNGTADAPIFVTIGILGLGIFISGAIFVAGGHIGEAVSNQMGLAESKAPATGGPPVPSKACLKCGTLLYQNTAFCPTCGASLAKTQPMALPAG